MQQGPFRRFLWPRIQTRPSPFLSLRLALALLALPLVGAGHVPLRVHFLDVGRGDCILLEPAQGRPVLLDGCHPERWQEVRAYLMKVGVKRLSLAIATHPNRDHLGGIAKTLRLFPADEVWENGADGDTEEARREVRQVRSRAKVVRSGEIWDHPAGLRLEVLSPADPIWGDLNEDSLVIRATYGAVRFLFTGDIGRGRKQALLKGLGRDLESDVLKVSHHGFSGDFDGEFLRAVMPKMAIITNGPGDPVGPPSSEILDSLEEEGAVVCWTGRDGTIIVQSDGKSFEIIAERKKDISLCEVGR